MTQQTARGPIPALTLGWRLRMALDYADISVQQMANQLGVSRTTLSRWMADKGERPKRAYISQWALSTGVPFEWIDSGQAPPGPLDDPDGDGGNRHPSERVGQPTPGYGDLPYAQLLHLPQPWLAVAQSKPRPAPDPLTRASLDRAA